MDFSAHPSPTVTARLTRLLFAVALLLLTQVNAPAAVLGTGTAVWHHQYDPLGNRIATLRPDGHKIERMTYGSGYVHGMLVDGEEIISFERDDLHREVERTLKNGLIHAQTYDPAGRLKEQVLQRGKQAGNASTGHLLKRNYAYDKAGQLTDIKDSGKGQRSYRYDPVGRLIESLRTCSRSPKQ